MWKSESKPPQVFLWSSDFNMSNVERWGVELGPGIFLVCTEKNSKQPSDELV